MKKSFGFGKKSLYLGLAFLVVVGLLSLFIFSGAREGFDEPTLVALTSSQVAALTASQVATLTTEQLAAFDSTKYRNANASIDRKTSDKQDRELGTAVLTTAQLRAA